MGMGMNNEEEVQMKDDRQAARCLGFANYGARVMNRIKNVLTQDLTPRTAHDIYVLSDQGASTTGVAHTTISDTSGINTIQFSDGTVASSLVFQTIQGNSTDFVLQYGQGDQIYIENGLINAAISNLNFSNNQVLTRADIMALAPALTISGGAGNDNIDGGAERLMNWDGATCAVLFGRIKREAANDAEGRMAA